MRELLLDLVQGMNRGGILYSEGTREFKRAFIAYVLEKHHGNQSKAARELGMHRNSLSRTLYELNMRIADYTPVRKPIGAEKLQQIAETRRQA